MHYKVYQFLIVLFSWLQICKICFEKNIPIIPHGTGTGLEAGISAGKYLADLILTTYLD